MRRDAVQQGQRGDLRCNAESYSEMSTSLCCSSLLPSRSLWCDAAHAWVEDVSCHDGFVAPGLEWSHQRAQGEGSILVSALIPALFQEAGPAELGLN